MNEYGIHEMGFGWLLALPLIILILYFINNQNENTSAREILDQRYAKGEINENEYRRMKKQISSIRTFVKKILPERSKLD